MAAPKLKELQATEKLVDALWSSEIDATIMLARTIARSGRRDGFAESCAEFVMARTGLPREYAQR